MYVGELAVLPTTDFRKNHETKQEKDTFLQEMMRLYAGYGVMAAQSEEFLNKEIGSDLTIELARNDRNRYLAKMEAIRECMEIIEKKY